ncbi:MAG TPA: hypothetical protein VLX59_14390, partial [Acidimicrobiales bacterium]|nr:hypothetical protein [Acidimicrobiales bacterium]
MSDTFGSRSRSRRDSLSGLRQLGRELRHPIAAEKASGQEMPARPRGGAHRRHRNFRRWPRRTLIAANIVTVLALLGAGGAYGYVQWRLGQIKRISVFGLHIEGKSTQSTTTGSSAPAFT